MPPSHSSFGRTTLGLLAGVFVVIIAIVGASLWFSWRASEHAEELDLERNVLLSAHGVLAALINAETGQRGYLLTGKQEFLEPYQSARNLLEVEFERLNQAVGKSTSLEPDVAALHRLADRKMAELEETIQLEASGRRERAMEIVNGALGRQIMDEVRETLNSMIDNAKVNVDKRLFAMEVAANRLETSTIIGGLLIVAFASGAYYVVAANMRQLVDARSEVEGMNVGLEQRVEQRTLALSRANDEIQRFAYIVSHDLRAPLVNIMGFTSELEVGTGALQEYFKTEDPSEEMFSAARSAAMEELPEAVQFIRSSTSKMDRLIGTILNLSREGRRELQPERIDLGTLMTNAATSLQHQIESADAKVDIPTTMPIIVSDRIALEQIFGNLLDNAIKYLEPSRPGVVTVSAWEDYGRMKISITDNGRGIAEKDKERIFDLFRRSGAQDTKGDGVGLTHVRALARRLGGDVSLSSRLGQGSTFEVELPKRSNLNEQSAST